MTSGVAWSPEEATEIKAKVIEYLKSTPNGTLAAAAQKAKVGYSTLYDWRAVDADFDKSIDAARKLNHGIGGDLAESKLMGKVNEGDTTSILFYLKTRHKDRGYVERFEQNHGGQENNPIKAKVDVVLSPEDAYKQMLGKE